MDNHEIIKETSMKGILDNFINSYTERDGSLGFSDWLDNKLRQEIPDMPKDVSKKLADEIIEAVTDYDKTLHDLNMAIDAGKSKEEWFAGRLSEAYAEMPLNIAGERLQKIEDNLMVSNIQLMQEIDDVQPEDDEVRTVEDKSVEWNEYSVKNKAYEIGNQFILTGMAVAANVLKEKTQGDEKIDISSIVMETFRDVLKKEPEEVKAVVAGAVKVAAEKGLEDLVPKDTPTDLMADMAGAAYESAEALYDAANGESTMLEAMDRIGRAHVAAGCRYASGALEQRLLNVPYIGPLLADLLGGLFKHMRGSKFAENVYTTVRDAAAATWKGVKKSHTVRAVRKVGNRIKKLFK